MPHSGSDSTYPTVQISGTISEFTLNTFCISANQRSFYSIRIVESRNLTLAFWTECSLIARVGWVAFKLDYSAVDLACEHAAILLADPTGSWNPFFDRG